MAVANTARGTGARSSPRFSWIARVLVACAAVAAALTPAIWAGAAVGHPNAGARVPGPPAGGTQAWAARDAGANGAYDQAGGMAVSPDGSTVYVVRTSGGAFVVAAHDAATGSRRWTIRTPGPGGAQVFVDAVVLNPHGTRLFVTGDIEQSIDTRSTLTIEYDVVHRSVLWSARLSPGRHRMAIPSRIAVGPHGARVFVTGSTTGTHGVDDVWDYFTVGYSAATGARLWKATYNGPQHRGDTSEGIGISPDGNRVFVAGTSAASGSDRDFATIAYGAADGSREWVARYSAGADNFASDLVVSPDGSRVYVAGYGRPSLNIAHGYLIVAYGTGTGSQAGVAQYADGGDDFATDLAISGDGSRLFVTGSGSEDFTTVAFMAPGLQRLWAARYDGGHGIDDAYAVAVSRDGARVYVTGESEEGRVACFDDIRSTAYATVEYRAATGMQGWVSRYAGLKKDPDQAREIAVSPDGSLVFVTGDSDFVCASSDVATVAYHA